MKKKFFLRALILLMVFSFASAAFADVEINSTNFPDETFRNYVSTKFDSDSNETLSDSEIANATSINLDFEDAVEAGDNPNSVKITSLKGIEYLTALTSLNCQGNVLTELELSKNINLQTLACGYNELTELDLSKNTELLGLHCQNNKLTKLNLGENTKLIDLYCQNYIGTGNHNQITELDLSKNTGLREIHCEGNALTKLNITGLVWLSRLYCSNNQLEKLDVSANTELSTLECYGNKLTELDLSKNSNLRNLKCYANQLRTLDLSNLVSNIDTGSGSVNFSSQFFTLSADDVLETTDDTAYPYSVKISALSLDVNDFERIKDLEANNYSDSDNTTLNAKVSGDLIYFSGKPSDLTYNYDTKYPSVSQEAYAYMDVTVSFFSDSQSDDPVTPDVPVVSPDTPVVSPDTPVVSPDANITSPDNSGGSGTEPTKSKSETPSSKAQESIAKTEVVEKVVSEIVKLFSSLPDTVKGEIKTLSNTYTGTNKTFTSSELSKIISDDEKNPVVLETMTVAANGIYMFKVPESNLTAGVKIFIHMLVPDSATIGSVKVAEKETESAVFVNDNGDVIDTVPASKDVNVTAYMQANTEYTPVVTQAADTDTASSSGGGCNSGLGIFGLLTVALIKKLKK